MPPAPVLYVHRPSTGNPHDKDVAKGRGQFTDEMPGPPQLVNPNPVRLDNAAKCTSNRTGGKSCTLTLASGRTLALNIPAHASSQKQQGVMASKRGAQTSAKRVKASTGQETVTCAPNTAPNASGNGCAPKYQTWGSDFGPGSTPGSSRSAPPATVVGTPHGVPGSDFSAGSMQGIWGSVPTAVGGMPAGRR